MIAWSIEFAVVNKTEGKDFGEEKFWTKKFQNTY